MFATPLCEEKFKFKQIGATLLQSVFSVRYKLSGCMKKNSLWKQLDFTGLSCNK